MFDFFKRRGTVLLVVSLVLALAAAMLARNWVDSRVRGGSLPGGEEPVVVAALEIPFGTKVEERLVKVVQVPSDAVPAGNFSSVEQVVGQIALQKILPGEMLLEERFSAYAGGSSLAAVIKPNMRAVTVRVNDVIGVAGFLLPGNKVDVVSARMVDRRAVTETILREINVLAVDQKAQTDQDEPVVVRAVTLEVSPQEAELLVKAREEGEIQLTLRNPLEADTAMAEAAPAATAAPARARTSTPAYETVTIIRGTNVETTRTRK
ncbi:MAG: Flp pilus assembly protein CpaB [Steroidobacteraceae bacterium]